VVTHAQAWRQVAAGIAIKRFGRLFIDLGDFHEPGDPDDDLEGAPIADAWSSFMDIFHHQAARGPRLGNQVYGGTVNFNNGLTDAGLQQYLKASKLWHTLCRPRTGQRSSSLAHTRRPSSIDMPLTKRVALHRVTPRHRRCWNLSEAQAALQRLYPVEGAASFRSESQKQLIESIIMNHAEVVGVLATGEGKSLAFMLPSLLPRSATTVVIIPLVALRQDMVRRCEEAGVPYAVWDEHTHERDLTGCPLLFAAVENLTQHSRLRGLLGRLDAAECLDRVVFDECHLVLTTSHYRPKMRLMKYLRGLRCQFVLLSATLPPLMMKDFEEALLLEHPTVVRSRTFRRDIFYRIKRQSTRKKGQSFMDYMAHGISFVVNAIAHEEAARVIVYVNERQQADELAALVGGLVYYSDSGSTEEKAAILQSWQSREHRVIVATSAFGMGVDYHAVRAVIHMGAPRDAIGFIQEVGRLGRDGGGGTSWVILPTSWQPFPEGNLAQGITVMPAPLAQKVMGVYLGECRCLHAVLSRFQDGAEEMQYCTAAKVEERCTMCQAHGLFDARQEVDYSRYWDGPAVPEGDAEGGSRVPVNGATESEEEDEEAAFGFHRGSLNLRQYVRERAQGREEYERRIRQFKGTCFICTLLQACRTPAEGEREIRWLMCHPLKRCDSIFKGEFFGAKKRAQHRHRDRGWLKAFVACFGCGQPQDICGQQGGGGCEYADMVLPAAWAVGQLGYAYGKTLKQLAGRHFESEEGWMDWIGEEREVHGMRAYQAVWVTDWVMGEMLRTGGVEKIG
jgi:hypothetical protein